MYCIQFVFVCCCCFHRKLKVFGFSRKEEGGSKKTVKVYIGKKKTSDHSLNNRQQNTGTIQYQLLVKGVNQEHLGNAYTSFLNQSQL